MSRIPLKRRRLAVGATILMGLGVASLTDTARADALPSEVLAALDVNPVIVQSAEVRGDAAGTAILQTPLVGFPTQGTSSLVISTGMADQLPGEATTFLSTDLPAAVAGADGNDLTQVVLRTRPPDGTTCMSIDFTFLSEEYPEYVGSKFNDIFTAELNDSKFEISNGQVVAPNNFAYDTAGNPVSINTVFGMEPRAGTAMDGATPTLTAVTPVERRVDGSMDVILSVQDLGDSVFDSAAVVDNLSFGTGNGTGTGKDCVKGTTELTDTDGDALPDEWETKGLDVDKNGTIDVDLPAMGADPNHKDLFIEVDHMVRNPTCLWFICWGGRDFAPQQDALADVRQSFASSPVSNPDGSSGVRVHIDSGAGSVMNPVTNATWGSRSRANNVAYSPVLGSMNGNDYVWSAYQSLEDSNFDLARRDVFHYTIYGDRYGEDTNTSSGISRGIPGGEMIVSDGPWNDNAGFTRTQERGTFMHELGHGLGLFHGGDLIGQRGSDYHSIMNYDYQKIGVPPNSVLDYSRGVPFDDWAHLRFDGGAVGARGVTEPPPATTVDDEATIQEFADLNALVQEGDGAVTFVGPTLLLPGTGSVDLLFDVHNPTKKDATYTVKATTGDPKVAGNATVTVPAGQTKRAVVEVDTAGLTPRDLLLAVVLTAGTGDDVRASTSGKITVADLDDPAQKAAAEQALKDLPGASGLDPQLKEQLEQALKDAVGAHAATLTVRPKGFAEFGQSSELASLTFAPDRNKPGTITATSADDELTLDLAVESKKQRPHRNERLRGEITFVREGGTVEASVYGFWNAATSTFAGTWHGTQKVTVDGKKKTLVLSGTLDLVLPEAAAPSPPEQQ